MEALSPAEILARQNKVRLSLESLAARHRELKAVFRALFADPIILDSFRVRIDFYDTTEALGTVRAINYASYQVRITPLTADGNFEAEFIKFSGMMASMMLLLTQLDLVSADGVTFPPTNPENVGTVAGNVSQTRSANPVLMKDLNASSQLLNRLDAVRLEFLSLFRLMTRVMWTVNNQRAATQNLQLVHLKQAALAIADTIESIANRATPNFTDPAFGLLETEETLSTVPFPDIIAGSFDYLTPELVGGELIHLVTHLLTSILTRSDGTDISSTKLFHSTPWYRLLSSLDARKVALQAANPMLSIAVKIELYVAIRHIDQFIRLGQPVISNNNNNLLAGLRQMTDYLGDQAVKSMVPLFLPSLTLATLNWSIGPHRAVFNQYLFNIFVAYDSMVMALVTKHGKTVDPEGWVSVAAHRVAIGDWFQIFPVIFLPDGQTDTYSDGQTTIELTPEGYPITQNRTFNSVHPSNELANSAPLAQALQRVLGVREPLKVPQAINPDSHHVAIVAVLNNVALLRKDIGPLADICQELVNVVVGTQYTLLEFNNSRWLMDHLLEIKEENQTIQMQRSPGGREQRAFRAVSSTVNPDPITVNPDPFSLYAKFARGARMVPGTQVQQGNREAVQRAQQRQQLEAERRRRDALLRVVAEEQRDVDLVRESLRDRQRVQNDLLIQVETLEASRNALMDQITILQRRQSVDQAQINTLREQASDAARRALQVTRELARSQAEQQAREAEIKILERELRDTGQESRDQRNLLEMLKQQNTDLLNTVDALRNELVERDQALNRTQASLAQLEQRTKDLDNQVAISTTEQDAITTSLATLTRENATLRIQIEDAEEQLIGAQQRANAAQREAQEQEAIAEAAERQGSEAAQEAAQARRIVEQATRQEEQARRELALAQQKIQEFESIIETNEAIGAQLKRDLIAAQEAIETLTRENNEVERQKRDLEDTVQIIEGEKASLQGRIEELEVESQSLEDDLIRGQTLLNEALQEIETLTDAVERQQVANQNLLNTVARQESELAELRSQLDQQQTNIYEELVEMTEERDALQKTTRLLSFEIQELTQALRDQKDSVQNLENELVAIRDQLRQETEQKETAEAEVAALIELIRSLQDELANVSSRLIGINLTDLLRDVHTQFYFETLERLGALVYNFNRIVVARWAPPAVITAAEQFDEALESYFLNGDARALDNAIRALKATLGTDPVINQNILDRLSAIDSLCGLPAPFHLVP